MKAQDIRDAQALDTIEYTRRVIQEAEQRILDRSRLSRDTEVSIEAESKFHAQILKNHFEPEFKVSYSRLIGWITISWKKNK